MESLSPMYFICSVRFRSAARPAGKLILSFTKDYLAEVKQLLREAGLAGVASERFLRTLSQADVIEAIRLIPDLRRHYRLQMEEGLAELIADELTKEPGLIVAPTLQILLAEMWEREVQATHDGRSFTRDRFRRVQAKGYRLPEFLHHQMKKIESWNKEVVDSGLLLDLLAAHTGPGGRASECRVEELRAAYSSWGSILDELIGRCKAAYLLVDPSTVPNESGQRLRFAHDTLAPLVRELYEASPAPGQQARRILETRVVDWQGDNDGSPLDEADLTVVEKGQTGMRAWTPAQERLVNASREQRQKRRRLRRGVFAAGLVALALIVAAGGVAEWHSKDQRGKMSPSPEEN